MKEKQKTNTKKLKDSMVVMEIPTAIKQRPIEIDKMKIYRTKQAIQNYLIERVEYAFGQSSTLKSSS